MVKSIGFCSICVLLYFSLVSPLSADNEITPSDVYLKAEQIVMEIELLKKHFGINKTVDFKPFKAELSPMHVWQKTYFIFTKINAFRSNNNFPVNTANSLEPVLEIDPYLNYEQTQRILLELNILKDRLGIKDEILSAEVVEGKQPIDVFNKLHEASLNMDLLNKEEINPTYIFAEVMRLFEDVTTVIQWLDIEDTTFPPARVDNVILSQILDETFVMMKELQRLERRNVLQITNFSTFDKNSNINLSDIFNMVGMCLAELQAIKASMDIKELTPPAQYQENKTMADVYQLLQWITRKFKLIRAVR